MVEPLRHRQTKGAATDMFYLTPPRHISTLHFADKPTAPGFVAYWTNNGQRWISACVGYDAIVESPGGISPPGAPRSVREPLDSHGSRCSAVGTRGQQLYLVHGLLLLPVGFSWPVASVEQCSPFAPAPLQDLHHYYGLLRPRAPHRYSRPHGFSRLRLLPLHRCDRFSRSIQEPGWASRRLHAGYRSGKLQGSPELIPEDGSAPGFDIV